MRYKTLYYNVEPIAKRLPDDCLKLIIQYAYDESKYNEWFQTISHGRPLRHYFAKAVTYGCSYEYYVYHVPKSTSLVMRLEYSHFIYNKCDNDDNLLWNTMYVPQLKLECDFTLFCNKRACMWQVTKRVQKIE